MGTTLSTRLAGSFKGGDLAQYRKELFRFALYCGVIGISLPLIAGIAGPKLIALVFTRDYTHDFGAFILLLVTGGVSYLVACVGYGLTSAGLFKVQVPWFGSMTLVTAALAWCLIPRYGMMGAAWAGLLSQTIQLVIGCAILYAAVPVEIKKHTGVKLPSTVA